MKQTIQVIEECLISALAKSYGTPLYVYSQACIRNQLQLLLKLFPPCLQLLFAIKANSNPYLLFFLLQNGVHGLETVSLEQVELSLKVGCKPQRILFTGNFSSKRQIERALELGVAVNLGEAQQIKQFSQLLKGKKIILRINTFVGDGFCEQTITNSPYSKFGIPVAQLSPLLEFCRQNGITVAGLHQHMGSNYSQSQKLIKNVKTLLALGQVCMQKFGTDFESINFGGGFGVPYKPDDKPFQIVEFFQNLASLLKPYQQAHPHLTYFVEPGRFIVAQAGSLLAQVTALKTLQNNNWAGINSGMNHLARPAMYNSYHHIRVSPAGSPSEQQQTYDICGNICQSGDILGRGRVLPRLRIEDILVIQTAGAYGFSMSSHYNSRSKPAEVWVRGKESRVIRKRQNLQDWLGCGWEWKE